MRRASRTLVLAVVAAMTSGCWLFPRTSLNSDVAEMDTQLQTLNQRVDQLEALPAGRSVSTASAATAVARGTAGATALAEGGPVGVESVARPGIRWPGFPSKDAFVKLIRGITNTLTGWVEIPKRMHETTRTSGAMAGFTYGLLRGIGYGFVRTLGGAYEVVTFPFPAPPGYQPVMRPAYIFTCEER